MEVVERQNIATPPDQGHRDELLRKSNSLWEGDLPQVGLVRRRIFDPLMGLENGTYSNSNEFLRIPTGNKMPGLEMPSSSRNSFEHYQRLLSEVPILHLIQVVRDRL
jgi:hypothetical protein